MEDGIVRFKTWLANNPGTKVDLSDMSLDDIQFSNLDLRGAIFKNSSLQRCIFRKVALEGADFEGANLANVNFNNSVLRNANFQSTNLNSSRFVKCVLNNANFRGVTFKMALLNDVYALGTNFRECAFESTSIEALTYDSDTLGLGKFINNRHKGLLFSANQGSTASTNSESTDNRSQREFRHKLDAVPPAHWALQSLTPPNDLSEEDRDLFLELRDTIKALNDEVSQLKTANASSQDRLDQIKQSVDDKLPLWKRAWESFVIKSAEGVAISASSTAAFYAGFIAGSMYATFSSESLTVLT